MPPKFQIPRNIPSYKSYFAVRKLVVTTINTNSQTIIKYELVSKVLRKCLLGLTYIFIPFIHAAHILYYYCRQYCRWKINLYDFLDFVCVYNVYISIYIL